VGTAVDGAVVTAMAGGATGDGSTTEGAGGAATGTIGGDGCAAGVAGAAGVPKPSFSSQLRSGAGTGGVSVEAVGTGAAGEGADEAGAVGSGEGSAGVFFLKKLNMLEGGLRRYIM
jgi:hypothetical protein